MNQFSIQPEGLKLIQKQFIIRMMPAVVILPFVIIFIAYYNNNYELLIFQLLLFVFVVAFGYYRNIERLKKKYKDFQLTIDTESITLERLNKETLTISHADIREINIDGYRSIIVEGTTEDDVIGIPLQIEHYEQIVKLLNEINPIAHVAKPWLHNIFWFCFAPLVSLLIVTIVLTNSLPIALFSGAALLTTSVFRFVLDQRNEMIEQERKKRGQLVLGVVILWTVIFICLKFFGDLW